MSGEKVGSQPLLEERKAENACLRNRELRRLLEEALRDGGSEKALEVLAAFPGRKAVNPLLAFLYDGRESLRREAIKTLAEVVARLAQEDREAARVVMRRLMWSLNDESGGIGWGSPEAMAEILIRENGLRSEYGHILLSYTDEEGNFLEHPGLQCGLLRALRRWAQFFPREVAPARRHLRKYLASPEAAVRTLAKELLAGLEKTEQGRPIRTGDGGR